MNINRQKHRIVLGEAWVGYSKPVEGYETLGTIQRGKLIGNLARHEDGRFFCVIDGNCEPLNQELVIKALRKLDFAV